MYEIRCIVGDKKLREVLVFLNNNNTLEPPVVIPTASSLPGINAPKTAPVQPPTQKKAPPKRRKKPIQQGGQHLKGRGSTQIVRDLLERTRATQISAKEMKRATVAAGYSSNAYSHAIKLLLADKTISPDPRQHGNYYVDSSQVLNPTQAHKVSQHG